MILMLAIVFLLLQVSRPGKQAVGCWQDCAQGEVDDGRILHILFLNMLHGYPDFTYLPQRLDLIAAEIRRLDVDVALLLEVPRTRRYGDGAAYLAQQTGMNYAYWRANGNWSLIGFEEGGLILSRYPLQGVSFVELEPQAGFFEHRIALHAVAVTPQGNLDLFVTHLTNGPVAKNAAQADSLLSFVDSTAVHTALIAGDFNATEDTVQIKKLAETWRDSYRMIHPADPGWTCCLVDLTNTGSDTLNERIDYLFLAPAAPEVSLRDVALAMARPFPVPGGVLWASDHIGLLVTLEIGP